MEVKKVIYTFLGCFIFIISIYASLAIMFEEYDEINNTRLADGFTISAYDIILDVKENNTIDVTENITVNFTNAYKHGLYKFVPVWLEYTNKDGQTTSRKSLVSNFYAVGEEYSIDTVNKKKRIKIGSQNEYVGLGEKTYTIKYNYNMGKDPYKGFDEFIFHAFGDYWGTEIQNATLEINMPKSIDGANINFFLDKYRKTNANSSVDYYVNGNSIYAKFNGSNELTKSLTIDIELPEGYFIGGSYNYGWGSYAIFFFVAFLTIWNFLNWLKYGKDYPKAIETIEFYPPENFDAAQIGFIYGKQTSKKLTIALIIELASKGYIRIDEIMESNKKKIQITNLVIPPEEKLSLEKLVVPRVIKVRKLKIADSNILNSQELDMMQYLFNVGDEINLDTNIDKFLLVKDSLIEKGFIEIISDNEDIRFNELNNRKEEYESSKAEYDKNKSLYDNKIASLTELEKIVYDRLFSGNNVIILSEHDTFYKAFNDVNNNLQNNLKDLIDDNIATNKMFQSMFITLAVFVLGIVSFFLIEDLPPSVSIIYYLTFADFFINLYLTFIMKRKTKYGEEIKAKVNGFRNFLQTAEKDRLEALVNENPNYFYNILPYSYVLNVSKKWVSKFENIPVPNYYTGSFNISNTDSFTDLYSDVYWPESSNSRSSGCSSCGGGCSSCGGGCSSCGGGGSW